MAAKSKNKPREVDGKAGIQPTVRTFTTWSTQRIRQAEIQADSGNLREAANLCDWLLTDDRIGGTLQTRTQALLGLVPEFEPAGDKRRSNRAVKALDAQEDWWASYPESELEQILTWGLILGVAPARHQWKTPEGHGGRWLPCPEFWHPQNLRWDDRNRQWLMRVASPGNPDGWKEVPIVAGDGTWILHTPFGVNRPWARGAWRALSRFALIKAYAIADWSSHSGKSSVLTGTSPKDVSIKPAERNALAQDIYERGREAVVVLPAGFDLKLVEAAANTKALFDAQIDMANKAIAIYTRGGNLTTEISSSAGSRAATESQERLGDDAKLRWDAQSLTTTVHDQSLMPWAEFNFGDPTLAPWPVYPTEPEEDLKGKVDSEDKALDVLGKAENLGLDVDREEFLRDHGITWAKPGVKPKKPDEPTKTNPEGDPKPDQQPVA
ncbi:MAG TPA: DUF935 family protein [Polyangiaceae bacterium]|nr:DUF935 family protein [Polyangiaceae bacterium]